MKGGLIVQQHNELKDAIGNLAAMIWAQVRRGPIVSDAAIDPTRETPCLIHTPKSVLFRAEI